MKFQPQEATCPLHQAHHCCGCTTEHEGRLLVPGNMLVLYTLSHSLGTWVDASSITILILQLTCTNQSRTCTHAQCPEKYGYTNTHTHTRTRTEYFRSFYKSLPAFLFVPCNLKSSVERFLAKLCDISNILTSPMLLGVDG